MIAKTPAATHHTHECSTCHLRFRVAHQYCPDGKTTKHAVSRFECIGDRCRASYRF